MIKLKVILPKAKKITVDKAVKSAAKDLTKRVHNTYRKLVSDWRDDGARDIDVKPEFDESVTKKSDGVLAEVKTDSLKYRFVDLGTKRHNIDPRPDNPTGLLTFPKGFTPRTTVRSLGKSSGGKDYQGPWITTPSVKHPGSDARHFEAPIIEEQTPLVIADLRKYIKAELKVDTYDL